MNRSKINNLLNNKPLKYLGNRYKQLREGLDDCTQEKLAKELNITKTQISDLERAKRYPSMNELIQYHNKFNVTLEYLLGLSNNKEYTNQTIGKELGLSDKTIECLKNWERLAGDDNLIDVLNCFFEMGYAARIFKYLLLYLFTEPISLIPSEPAKEYCEIKEAIVKNSGDISTVLSVKDLPYLYLEAFREVLISMKSEIIKKNIKLELNHNTSWLINTVISEIKEK